jgi:hypothetical protein
LEESWESPFREDLSAEAEESPVLEAIIRERLVKTQQAKGLGRCCGDLNNGD